MLFRKSRRDTLDVLLLDDLSNFKRVEITWQYFLGVKRIMDIYCNEINKTIRGTERANLRPAIGPMVTLRLLIYSGYVPNYRIPNEEVLT